MDLEQLKQILDLVRTHELSEFEVEQDGLKLKIRRNAAGVPVVTIPALPATAVVAAAAVPTAAGPATVPAQAVTVRPEGRAEEREGAEVKAQTVGTFVSSPERSAAPCACSGA